jgi:hypothetical protein
MPKRSRSEASVPQIVFKNVTITNYFATAPVIAPAPATEQPTERIFPTNADRLKRVSVKSHGKWCSVYAWYSTRDGTLKGGCYHMCRNQFVDLDNFAPTDGSAKTQGDRNKFDAAHLAYKVAHAAGDHDECVAQRAVLEKLRTDQCFKCRHDPGHLSPKAKECKEWYDAKRKAAAVQNDGCANQDCPERGPDVWCVLSAEHGTNPKKKDVHGDPVGLSNYAKWPGLGGVPAMIEEDKQVEKWTCLCCARLDPSSSSANRCGDPEDMPDGKPGGTKAEVKQYNRKYRAVRVHPKQKYVDECKWDDGKGECAECKRPVVEGEEVMFDWNHRDEATKCKGGLFGGGGGGGGGVHNHSTPPPLDLVKHLLDAEMKPKCDLVCTNCHHRHTNKYPRSATVV